MSTVVIGLDTYGWTGIADHLGYTIYNADGTVYQVRVATGITESPAGSGCYVVTVDVDDIISRRVVWDTGDAEATTYYAQEIFGSDLSSLLSPATFTGARSLHELANMAYDLYPKGESRAQYLLFAEMIWRDFISRAGAVYSGSVTLTYSDGVDSAILPYDFRRLRDSGVTLVRDDSTKALLSPASERDIMESLAADEPTEGEPTGYWMPNARTLQLTPIPDGDYTVVISYDAEAPSIIDTESSLPIPAKLERGLVAGIVAEKARVEADWERAGREQKRYEDMVDDWERTNTLRQRRPLTATPYWAERRVSFDGSDD